MYGFYTNCRKDENLQGTSHKILLSDMSQPGIEVLIEKLLLELSGRLGKENSPKKTNLC